MQIVQLNPTIPVDTPKGSGLAHFYIWLSEEHHALWVVCNDETGEWWTWENPRVRGTKNISFGRIVDNNFLKEKVSSKVESGFVDRKTGEKFPIEPQSIKYNPSPIDLGGC